MMIFTRRGLLGAGTALAAPLLLPAAARAQEGWKPTQPVRIVVPAAPGGTTDIMGRVLAAHLQTRWPQNIIVENKSGGGGTVGTMDAVRAKPDGHTILLGNIGPQSIAYSLFRNLTYKPTDLLPVSNMIRGPNVLVVHPSVPAKTVPEFVAWLRRNNEKVSYGTAGLGQSPHVSGMLFHQMMGIPGTAVHFRGAAPAMVSLVAGDVQYMFDNLTSGVEQVRAGKVRALAVTSADRNSQLPDLPALRETLPELANYDVNTWFGAFYPAGTPAHVVQALNSEIKILLDQPETRQRFITMGGVADYGTVEQYAAFVRAETEKWGAVMKKEGLQVDVG